MNKRQLWTLDVTSWNAGDYFAGKCCNSTTFTYLFATSDEAKAFAMGVDADSDSYNECMLYHGELTEEEILEESGFETMEDFDEALREPYSTVWNRKNFGEDEKTAVAVYIQEKYDNTSEEIPCANYDFDKSIEGAIIVVWSWRTHVGYAREFKELRYATYDETEKMLTKEDRIFVPQVDIVMTADEVANSKHLRDELTEILQRNHWKWTKPSHVDFAIMDF